MSMYNCPRCGTLLTMHLSYNIPVWKCSHCGYVPEIVYTSNTKANYYPSYNQSGTSAMQEI